MTSEILYEIAQLFISFMSAGGSIALFMYFISWVTNIALSFIFPSRYGV